jgi:hypothetical protein
LKIDNQSEQEHAQHEDCSEDEYVSHAESVPESGQGLQDRMSELAKIMDAVILKNYGVSSWLEYWKKYFEQYDCIIQWLETGVVSKECSTRF